MNECDLMSGYLIDACIVEKCKCVCSLIVEPLYEAIYTHCDQVVRIQNKIIYIVPQIWELGRVNCMHGKQFLGLYWVKKSTRPQVYGENREIHLKFQKNSIGKDKV